MGQLSIMGDMKNNNTYQTEIAISQETQQNKTQNTAKNVSCFNRVVTNCANCLPFIVNLGLSVAGGAFVGYINGSIMAEEKAATILDMPPIPRSGEKLEIFARGTDLLAYNRDLIMPISAMSGAIVGGLGYLINKMMTYTQPRNVTKMN
jgi:hypothetical protein